MDIPRLESLVHSISGKIVLLILILPRVVPAQSDSIVYRSAFEKKVFIDVLFKKAVDNLLLLTVHDGDSADFIEIQNELNSFYNYLTPKLKKKDTIANARTIFNEVQKRFLVNYVDTASFTSVFMKSFNCVSGTALYAVVLDHYEIPYEIRELPTHVYLVAFPKTNPLTFESTSRSGFAPDLKTKSNMVRGLVAKGLFSQEHVDEVGFTKAYDEYFFPRAIISLRNLAGAQYYNTSFHMRIQGDYRAALSEIRKCDILYQAGRNLFFKLDFLERILNNMPIDNAEMFQYVIDYTNLRNDEKNNQFTDEAFRGFLGKFLIRDSNEAMAREVYDNLIRGLKNPALKTVIRTSFNGGYAHYYFAKSQYDQSLKYATEAWEENSNDVTVQSLIIHSIISMNSVASASPLTIKKLNAAANKFPFFRTNSDVRLVYILIYSSLSYANFLADHEKEGNYYMNLMQKEMNDAGNSIERPATVIGYAYAEGGAHYYREDDFKKALEIMNLGLKYAPGHPEVLERLKIVKEAMQRGSK